MGDGSNVLMFSAASGWEIAIKARLGKLQLPDDIVSFLTDQLVRNHVTILSIHLSHTLHVYTLPPLHRDPFDRLLVAQSQLEQLPIVTADPLIQQYSVQSMLKAGRKGRFRPCISAGAAPLYRGGNSLSE